MNTQAKEISPIEAFVTDCLAYSGNAVRIAALKEEQAGLVSANGELRKRIVPFFKEHKGEKWSSLGKSIKAAIVAAGVKDVDGLLGVLKTSFEYNILPTEQNADRLRKRESWVSWSGVVVPNTYGKVHKNNIPEQPMGVPATTQTAPTSPIQETAKTQPQTASKAPSKATTPQKAQEPTYPISSSVSSSEAPISSQEHFTTLWMQISKVDTFKLEFVDMMAAALDVSRATLTNVMWQSAEQIIKGTKA